MSGIIKIEVNKIIDGVYAILTYANVARQVRYEAELKNDIEIVRASLDVIKEIRDLKEQRKYKEIKNLLKELHQGGMVKKIEEVREPGFMLARNFFDKDYVLRLLQYHREVNFTINDKNLLEWRVRIGIGGPAWREASPTLIGSAVYIPIKNEEEDKKILNEIKGENEWTITKETYYNKIGLEVEEAKDDEEPYRLLSKALDYIGKL